MGPRPAGRGARTVRGLGEDRRLLVGEATDGNCGVELESALCCHCETSERCHHKGKTVSASPSEVGAGFWY